MKNYIFDLYNTLIDVKTDEHCKKAWTPVGEYFAAHGIKTDEKRLCYEFDRYWKLFNERAAAEHKFLFPECDCVTQFESMARSVGGRLSREAATEALRIFRRASIERLTPFDGARALLDELKAMGKNVYLLSNAQAAFTYDEIKECGLDGAFDGMLISSEHGCRKPDPAYFGRLFDKYGLEKNESVMIGDDRTSDIEGANRFGIASVWVPGGAAAHRDEILDTTEQ